MNLFAANRASSGCRVPSFSNTTTSNNELSLLSYSCHEVHLSICLSVEGNLDVLPPLLTTIQHSSANALTDAYYLKQTTYGRLQHWDINAKRVLKCAAYSGKIFEPESPLQSSKVLQLSYISVKTLTKRILKHPDP